MQEQGGDASTSAIAADDSGGSPTSVFTIMSLCFLVAIVCALDRVAMSVAIVPMGNVYDYTDTTKGLVSRPLRGQKKTSPRGGKLSAQ